jgi:AcrR family transcriptional regulator
MINDNKISWIICGYEIFSRKGPDGLKIEVLARKVNKSKSSFYHYFANIEIFTEILLEYHLEKAEIISKRENECKSINPELLNVLIEFKQDLLFNRQLRVNRNVIEFKNCFEKASKKVAESIIEIWAKDLNIKNNSYLAEIILKLTLENFYLQITEETMTFDWLQNYFKELQNMVAEFEKNSNRAELLYGSV